MYGQGWDKPHGGVAKMLRDDRMAARPGYCMRSNVSRPRNMIGCNVSRGTIDTCQRGREQKGVLR